MTSTTYESITTELATSVPTESVDIIKQSTVESIEDSSLSAQKLPEKEHSVPEIAEALKRYKAALDKHIFNFKNIALRNQFYEELDRIEKNYADDLEKQFDEITRLCLRVKEAETGKKLPNPIEAQSSDKAIAGATAELDTAEEAQRLIKTNRLKKAKPPHIRKEAIRDFKNPKSPDYISTNQASDRYFLKTKNDDKLAERIKAETEGYILNDTTNGRKGNKDPLPYWLYWGGTAYVRDMVKFDAAVLNAINTLNEEYAYLSEQGVEVKDLNQFLTFINKSQNDDCIQKALKRLQNKDGISFNFNVDSDHGLLSLENIIFDSTNGRIIPIEDVDEINKLKKKLPIHFIPRRHYKPNPNPKKFLKMVYDFCYDNQDPYLSEEERDRNAKQDAAWLCRFFGYALVAGNPEGIALVFIGEANGGKTTLINTVGLVLIEGKEYWKPNIKELLSGSQNGPKDTLSIALPMRLGLFDEGNATDEKGGQIDSGLFKRLLTCRFSSDCRGMYGLANLLPDNMKMVLSMNESPHFDRGIDSGTLRRLVTIPSTHFYSDKEKLNDYDLLVAGEEADDIISLMINECIAYRQDIRDGKKGLLPIPENWRQFQAKMLGGYVYSSFLNENYEPITDMEEKKKPENRIYRDELITDLIRYARENYCDEELGHIIQQSYSDENGNFTTSIETLNKGAQAKLRATLLQLGYGDYKNNNKPRPYIYAKYIGNGPRTIRNIRSMKK